MVLYPSIQTDHADHSASVPIILFGAFDRHNFGDLLFAHIATALLQGKQIIYAGLQERDMRIYGGHLVCSLTQLASYTRNTPVHVLHAGGEVLTCSAWEAAVMLLPAREAYDVITRCGGNVDAQAKWAQAFLGIPDLAPYALARTVFTHAATVAYNAVGGVDLASQNSALRDEVVDKLRHATLVTVRDRHTLTALHAVGVEAHLLPDPAVMVAELFAEEIEQHARHGEPTQVCKAFPRGYLAVQFSADFGDAGILECMAAQLERVAAACHYGIVLFRAGSAPWHDDLGAYRQLAARLRKVPLHIFQSLNVWDICALIASSRGYCGSSLHGRIIALAFGLPRLNLLHPDQPATFPTKQDAFIQTWEDLDQPGIVAVEELEQGLHSALHTDPQRRHRKAKELAAMYRHGFTALRTCLMAND